MIGRRPPRTMQLIAAPFGGRGPAAEVDAFSERPLVDFLTATQSRPSLTNEPAPEMFSSGTLPPFTSSGVEVELLCWIHWRMRHAAAATPDRALVYLMAEAGEDGEAYTTPEGEAAWRGYVSRVWRWAIAPASDAIGEFTSEDYNAFWGAS